MADLLSTPPTLAVIIPWCDRPEISATLESNRAALADPGLQLLVVNCGGDLAELDRLLQSTALPGLSRLDLPGASFNKALALNAGVAATDAAELFFLDTDIVLADNFLDRARRRLSSNTFVTVQQVVENSPPPRHHLSGLHEIAHLIELVSADGTTQIETNRSRPADGSRSGPGLILLRREHFLAIDGMNSDLEGWGFEDLDLVTRLQLAQGLRRRSVGTVVHLTHDDEVRTLGANDRAESEARNRMRAFYNYGQRHYLGTYDDDLQQWREHWTQHRFEPLKAACGQRPQPLSPTPSLRLSVVDQVPLRHGDSAAEALGECVELARTVERLGYQRFWIAEHHNASSFACTSPEVLIPLAAAATRHLRIGSGGMLLRNTSALKTAELFRTLSSCFPHRLDLGIGGATGGDPLTSNALAHPRPVLDSKTYGQQVRDLLGFLAGQLPSAHDFATIRSQPGPPNAALPEVWLLGSSPHSAQLAGELGLSYAFADFLTDNRQLAEVAADAYREAFKPSPALVAPQMLIAVEAICAPTEEEARHLAASRLVDWFAELYGLQGLLPADEAANLGLDSRHGKVFDQFAGRCLVGSPAQVHNHLLDIAQRTAVQQFSIITNCYAFESRCRSYQLLASELGL